MNIKHLKILIISLIIPLAVGFLSGLISRNNIMTYAALNKPLLSPPAYVFPVVWTILYLLMGISAYRIAISGDKNTGTAFTYYVLQLFFNFFWTILFFTFNLCFAALIWLLILIALIIQMIRAFYDIDHAAAYLQIPYLLWCLFAAYLNLSICLLN